MNAFFGHLKNILRHKYYVCKYCFKLGLYWRGIKHDFSKFSPTEFFTNVKYYGDGKRSPIDNMKDKLGYSPAWQHHKGRNDHHYEYWTDNYDKGTTSIIMSRDAAMEMLCDFVAASIVYSWSGEFNILEELVWWKNKFQSANAMNDHIKIFVTLVFTEIATNLLFGNDTTKGFFGLTKDDVYGRYTCAMGETISMGYAAKLINDSIDMLKNRPDLGL